MIASAESCTGGRVAAALTSVAGASSIFASGVVCYSDQAKRSLVGVDPNLIETHTAVSPEVAEAMAIGIAKRLYADIGISTTGYLDIENEEGAAAAGLAFVGINYLGQCRVHRLFLSGDRESQATQVVHEALELLLARISEEESSSIEL